MPFGFLKFKPGQQVDNKSDKAIDAEIERLSKKQSFRKFKQYFQ